MTVRISNLSVYTSLYSSLGISWDSFISLCIMQHDFILLFCSQQIALISPVTFLSFPNQLSGSVGSSEASENCTINKDEAVCYFCFFLLLHFCQPLLICLITIITRSIFWNKGQKMLENTNKGFEFKFFCLLGFAFCVDSGGHCGQKQQFLLVFLFVCLFLFKGESGQIWPGSRQTLRITANSQSFC